MKKVLYVSRDLTHMYFHIDYLKHLVKNGCEVSIACGINKNTDDFTKEGIKCINIDFERKAISLKHKLAYNQIKTLCEKEEYDLIHFHTPIAAFIGRMATRKVNSKIVYTAHGLHFFKGAPIQNWLIYYPLEKLAARWTDAIILINKEDFNRVKNSFMIRKKDNVYFINGVGIKSNFFKEIDKATIDQYKDEYNKENKFVISCVGELNGNKNQIFLLNAISQCNNKDKIKCLIVGEGPNLGILKGTSENNNLDCEFLGYRRDVPNILAISDVLALVSKREGLPKSIMEGMASELAILGTNTRGIRDMIKDNVNGFVVDLDDVKDLSDKIDLLYKDTELLEDIKETNLIKSMEYDINTIITELDHIYNIVLKEV